tara:strand:- start:1866 stop:2174 length:309 start_codon:yes stop_codon:yes gene_type:complete
MNILSEATTLQIRKDRLSQKAESARKLRRKLKTEKKSLLQTAKFYTELKNVILSISSDFSKIIKAVENDESSTISTIDIHTMISTYAKGKLHNFHTNQGIFT